MTAGQHRGGRRSFAGLVRATRSKLWPRPGTGTAAAVQPPLTGITDLHCHLLPGVDDGARDLDTALELCRRACEEGVAVAITTPHTLDGVYDVQRATARRALQTLRTALGREGIPLRVELAAECRYDAALPTLLRDSPDVSLDGAGRYLLLELPHEQVPAGLPQLMFALQTRGTTPVIAHPERNLGVRRDPDQVEAWVERGVLLQLTAGSLSGAFGGPIGRCAERLLRRGWAHVVASDAHSPGKRPPAMQAAVRCVRALVGNDAARALFVDNPAAIARGAPVHEIRPARGRRAVRGRR